MKKTAGRSMKKQSRRGRHKKNCQCKKHRTMRKMTGGNINPASFQPFQSHQDQYYYDVNTHNNDPNNPNVMVSARNLPNMSGGSRHTRRKLRGGNPFFPGSTNNALTNFGNYDMAGSAKTIINGELLPNSDVFDQPSAYTYTVYRPPLA